MYDARLSDIPVVDDDESKKPKARAPARWRLYISPRIALLSLGFYPAIEDLRRLIDLLRAQIVGRLHRLRNSPTTNEGARHARSINLSLATCPVMVILLCAEWSRRGGEI